MMLVKFVEQPHVTAVARNFWFNNENKTYFKVFIIPRKTIIIHWEKVAMWTKLKYYHQILSVLKISLL